MADENLNEVNNNENNTDAATVKTDAIITDEAKEAWNIMLGLKEGTYESELTKEAKDAIKAMLKLDKEATYESYLTDEAIDFVKAILDVKEKEEEAVTPTSTIQISMSFTGVSSMPNNFAISNSYNDNVFTLENATGTDTYVWTLSNVPVNTEVVFTESGIQIENYTLAVNELATTESEYSESIMSTENTIVALDFNNVYTAY